MAYPCTLKTQRAFVRGGENVEKKSPPFLKIGRQASLLEAWVGWRRNDEDRRFGMADSFSGRGQRLRLLDLMTGTQKTDRLVRFVTKNTYVLANSVQGFRDFGVHPKATEIKLEVGYSALHVCIELAATVTSELSSAAIQAPTRSAPRA